MDLIGVPFFLSEHSEHSEHSEALTSNFLLNRLNLCELFFEKSVREGGVIIFVKKWVLIGFLMD